MTENRLLVADDDARWSSELSRHTATEFVKVITLSDAMSCLDKRRRWTGAIFDRYLVEGQHPFPPGRLASEAGFILAVAFLEKFPDRRVCVCSGDPDMLKVPPAFEPLIKSANCLYLYKGRPRAAANAIRFVLEGRRPNSRFTALLDHLVLQPNMFGLGINLRTVIDSILAGARSRGDRKD